MLFDQFFRNNSEQDQINKERKFQTTGTILNQQQQQIDEMQLLEKREVLLQLTQWQQDRTPAMRKLFEKLSAYTFDTKSGTLNASKWDTPYCSLVGASKLVSFIEPLDHNVMLGNWGDQVLTTTLRDAIAHPLRRFIRDNHNELGISIDHAEYVFWNIMNAVEPTYWRGWNNGERKKDQEMIKINEVRNVEENKKKGGMFGINK